MRGVIFDEKSRIVLAWIDDGQWSYPIDYLSNIRQEQFLAIIEDWPERNGKPWWVVNQALTDLDPKLI